MPRVDGDGLPLGEAGHPGAQRGDPAGDLVAEDQGVGEGRRAGGALPPVRDAGAADAAPLHGEQHLVPRGREQCADEGDEGLKCSPG
jgi:hypothetical protein